jgi:glutathione S-transferase
MPKILGANASPFVRKTRVALAEKGIAYELVPVVPIGVSAEFKQKSPLGKIPVFEEDDGWALPDSSCIIAYLERTRPEPSLYPKAARDFGRALFLEEYGDTKLVEAIAPVFFNRVVQAKILKGKCDEARVAECLEKLQPPVFDWLETQVPEAGDGIVGGRFSVADIALASPFVNLEHAGERPDRRRWPRLAAYLERVHARPSFKACIEEEKAALSRL